MPRRPSEAGSMHGSMFAEAVAVFRGCQHSGMLRSQIVLCTSILLVPYFQLSSGGKATACARYEESL
jgi:hypothetical protein